MPRKLKFSRPINYYIKTAKAHANQQWRRAALAAVKRLARRQNTFTTADVLHELDRSTSKTHDLRAIGSVMIDARDQNLIESAGLVRRNDKHSRGATTLWKSKILRSSRIPENTPRELTPSHT